MSAFRWIVGSGFRVTMLIALAVFAYHVTNELRVLFGRPLNFHQRMELTALDVKFAARGAKPPEQWKVAIAAADEKALKQFGPLPWSRAVHAKLVRKLDELGAKSVAFDMTFENPSRSDGEIAVHRLLEHAKLAGLMDAASGIEKSASATERIAELLKESKPKKLQTHAEPLRTAAKEQRRARDSITRFSEELARAAVGEDADQLFVDAVRESRKVVLGIVSLSKSEAESLGIGGPDQMRALKLVATSTIGELVSLDDGLEHIHSDVKRAFDEGIYQKYFGVHAPFEALAKATPHFGTINAIPDDDGVYRRVSLVSAIKGAGVLVPTLGLKAVEVALAPDTIQVIGSPEDPTPDAIQIGDRRFETELSARTILDWYGRFSASEMPIVSIADLVDGTARPESVKDRVVFVAATAIGTHDQRVTPLERAVPGVYIHATLAQNLLDGRSMTRPKHIIAIELLLLLAIGLIAGWVMTRLNVVGQIGTALAMAAGWLLIDQTVLFANGLVVYTVLPVFQIFFSLLAVALYRFLVEQRERQKTRQAFGRYLAPAVMEQVLTKPEEYLKLGGRRYEATVLFSDIRGFTTISEALTPEELGTLLNRYMTPMTDIVFEFGGTLDKYIGDAVMAFWGAPLEQPDHAVRACKASLKMVATVEALNKEFEAAGLPRIAIGIGLSSGPMTIGNMGSDDHFAYTALGDRVNLGARLEGQTKDYGVDVIISDACYQLVKDEMMCRELGALRVKGKYEPVRIYELIAEKAQGEPRRTFVETFHAGLASFRAQQWDEAIEHFTRARALSGVNGDKCSDHYIMWCLEYKESPPPRDWDGVRIATSK
jgi:adenylate cyclase